MGGADLADQMLKYYHMERRTIKWYKKLYFHLVDNAVHNAFVVYKQNTQPDITALKFRIDLIDQLLNSAGPDPTCRGGTKGRPRPSGTDLQRLNSVNHYPSLNPVSNVTGMVKFRSCRVCNKTNKRAESSNRK